MGDQELVDCLADIWGSLLVVGAELSEAEWKQPSLLPGWSIQDVYAHMAGTEAMLLGRPAPDHVAPEYAHVQSPIGQIIENGVDFYRSASGIEVLGAFAEVVDEQLDVLRTLDADGFAAPSRLPLGDGTVRGLLPFRIVDCWIHEQDVRLALDRPGGWETPAVDVVFNRLFAGMGKVVAKLAGAHEGAAVQWRVGGASYAVEVHDGRGRPVDHPSAPTVVLVMDPQVFLMLAAGRGEHAELIAQVRIEGDAALGTRVLEHMNVLF